MLITARDRVKHVRRSSHASLWSDLSQSTCVRGFRRRQEKERITRCNEADGREG